MPQEQFPKSILNHVRPSLGKANDGPSDSDLVTRYVDYGDEAAFELLVWRYSSMLIRVCRAVHGDHHAAEDTTQAVFMVLARKAASIGNRESLAGWLCRTAHRLSVKTMSKIPRSRTLVEDIADSRDASQGHPHSPLIMEEVAALPEKYRIPVLFCFFEGMTYPDAARRLGCPIGTLAARINRAKAKLERKLIRRGVVLPATALAAIALESSPTIAYQFVTATARSAAAFAAGRAIECPQESVRLATHMLREMFVRKMKFLCGIVAFFGATAFAGAAMMNQAGRSSPSPVRDSQISESSIRSKNPEPMTVEKLKRNLLGAWELTQTNDPVPKKGDVLILNNDGKIDEFESVLANRETTTYWEVDDQGCLVLCFRQPFKELTYTCNIERLDSHELVLTRTEAEKRFRLEFKRTMWFVRDSMPRTLRILGTWKVKPWKGSSNDAEINYEFLSDGKFTETIISSTETMVSQGKWSLKDDQLLAVSCLKKDFRISKWDGNELVLKDSDDKLTTLELIRLPMSAESFYGEWSLSSSDWEHSQILKAVIIFKTKKFETNARVVAGGSQNYSTWDIVGVEEILLPAVILNDKWQWNPKDAPVQDKKIKMKVARLTETQLELRDETGKKLEFKRSIDPHHH